MSGEVETSTAINVTLDDTYPQRVTDSAHAAEGAADLGHREGFCKACAAIYLAVVTTPPQADSGSTSAGGES